MSDKKPPVIEIVVGTQFTPIPGFSNAHLGLFWQALGPQKWPKTTDMQPVEPVQEVFGIRPAWEGVLRLKLHQDPSARLFVRTEREDRLVQLQNGRLHYNWGQQEGGKY